MIKVKISELLGIYSSNGKVSKVRLALLVTGILSAIIVLATVYGHYAGNAFISMTKEAEKKGIELSETADFENGSSMLNIETIDNFQDILESFLNIEEAEKVDGLYYEDDRNYYAYTFYLRNSGEEVVNVNYKVRVVEEKNKVADAMFIKIRESIYIDGQTTLLSDNNYSRAYTKTNQIVNNNIKLFVPGDIRKFTLFVWADGQYTTASMLDGYAKVDLVFSITNTGN